MSSGNGAAPRIARDTILLPEMGDVMSRGRAVSYIGQLHGQLLQTNKEGWTEWAASFFKSRTGRPGLHARGGPMGAGAAAAAARRGGAQRVGRLLVEVLRARDLNPELSFDPYVTLSPMPGGEPQRTAVVDEGGANPSWGAEHRNQFVFDIDDGAVALEVEVR